MNRKVFTVFAIFASIILINFPGNAAQKQKIEIFCAGDCVLLGAQGLQTYTQALKSELDERLGKDKAEVDNFSFYDMNTSQCLKIIQDAASKPEKPAVVVLMAGEANFYNISGYSDYLLSEGKYETKKALIDERAPDALREFNSLAAEVYSSPLARSKKGSLKYALASAYNLASGAKPKKIGGYVPKIVPSFAALESNETTAGFSQESLANRYALVWEYINSGNFAKAVPLAKEMLEANPLDARAYYALGYLYLLAPQHSGLFPDDDSAGEALKMFEEGILNNPFDPSNQCYKGLSVLFMSYDGKIDSEVLYFARIVKNLLGEKIPEINAVCAFGQADYERKLALAANWAVSDIKKINSVCKDNGIKLIIADYPLNAKINPSLKGAFSFGGETFISVGQNKAGKNAAVSAKRAARIVAETIERIL